MKAVRAVLVNLDDDQGVTRIENGEGQAMYLPGQRDVMLVMRVVDPDDAAVTQLRAMLADVVALLPIAQASPLEGPVEP